MRAAVAGRFFPSGAPSAFGRPDERTAMALAEALQQPDSTQAPPVLAGAICVAIWGISWLLLLFAVMLPAGRMVTQVPTDIEAAVDGLITADGSSDAMDLAPRCPSGRIELEGRCVVGEELEVRPPPGWKRGLNASPRAPAAKAVLEMR